jgi:hypothetical protein
MSLKQVDHGHSIAVRHRPLEYTLTKKCAVQEIETWVLALTHYDNSDFEEALKVFDSIADTSKIQFNCGVIFATLGEHVKAVGPLSDSPREMAWNGC